MKKENDGGNAFPLPIAYKADRFMTVATDETGMSLRDYFAAKAMQSYLINNHTNVMADIEGASFEEMAEDSYRMADSMLEIRKN